MFSIFPSNRYYKFIRIIKDYKLELQILIQEIITLWS